MEEELNKFGIYVDKGYNGHMKVGGIFSLPSEFVADAKQKQLTGRFVEVGPNVTAAKERQPIAGLPGVFAEGWDVWKYANGKAHFVISSNKKKYVLMCRRQETQAKVNMLYGQLSNRRVMSGIEGSTVNKMDAEMALQELGLMTDSILKNLMKNEEGNSIETITKSFGEKVNIV